MSRLNMQKAIIATAVALASMLLVTGSLALFLGNRTIPNSGTIKAINVSVYQDSNCTQALSSITWGMLDPGSSSQKTMYVKNEGNTAMTLNMTITTWSPANTTNYITVTWNQEGTVVNPGSNVQANVTLALSQNITGITNFTFTMIISGSS